MGRRTCEAWSSLSSEEVLRRVASAWPGPDDLPIIYDTVWFEATEKGEEYVAGYSPKDSGLAVEETE